RSLSTSRSFYVCNTDRRPADVFKWAASWASSDEERGKHLFRLACKRELEGIVAERKFDPYLLDNTKWYKIRNRNYSQRVEGETLFERERSADPGWHNWNVRASAGDNSSKPDSIPHP